MFKNPFRPDGWNQSDKLFSMDHTESSAAGHLTKVMDIFHVAAQNDPHQYTNNSDQSETNHLEHLDSDGQDLHFVHPHYVHSYDRADGTHVDGYWRDGDGNTHVDLTTSEGGGYYQHDPYSLDDYHD